MSDGQLDFESEVLRKSHKIPVLVDFWAPWCGACRVLSPQLEVLRERHRGEWELVKINTEAHPELSIQNGIKAIPTVKLFLEGKVVGEFAGALPGHVIEEWLKTRLPGTLHSMLEQARQFIVEGRKREAEELLARTHQQDPHNPVARVLLAYLVVLQDPARAKVLIAGIEPAGAIGELVEAVSVVADFMTRFFDYNALPASPGRTPFLQAISALYAGDLDSTLENLLLSLERDKAYLDGFVRDVFMALLTYLGSENPKTHLYRNRLVSVLQE